ncbi:MAG: peptidoglycan editing factor PgeF [Candidatus Saccharimonadales bacterium]
MKLIIPAIFESFPEVAAAMSLRDQQAPSQLNMSLKTGDNQRVTENLKNFCLEVGIKYPRLAIPEQDHTDIVHVLRSEYHPHLGDGIITNEPGWLVGVRVADCIPLLLYDPDTSSYGAIHSGWRGSAANITATAVHKMMKEFQVNPENIYAWIGPSADGASYEVGQDVFEQFNPKYSQNIGGGKWLFDNKAVVYDQLVDSGLLPEKIEVSSLDSITNQELHSYRRDNDKSGRMLAAIGVV